MFSYFEKSLCYASTLLFATTVFSGPDPWLIKKYEKLVWQSPIVEVSFKKVKQGEAFAEVLKTNRSLSSLSIVLKDKLDAESRITIAHHIVDALKHNTKLEKLRFHANSDEGAIVIAESLANLANTTIKEFSVNCNLTDKGAHELALVVENNPVLVEIVIGQNQVSDDGARKIAQALATNHTIKSFSFLDNTTLSDDGAKAFARAIAVNDSLTSMHVFGSNIGNEGKKSLLGALKANYTLSSLAFPELNSNTELNFAYSKLVSRNRNLIGDAQLVKQASNAMADKKTYKVEFINHGHSEEKFIVAFAEALRSNKTVTSLEVKFPAHMTKIAGVAMAAAIAGNNRLKTFHYFFPTKGFQWVSKGLEKNFSITEFSPLYTNYRVCANEGAMLANILKTNTRIVNVGELEICGDFKALNEILSRNEKLEKKWKEYGRDASLFFHGANVKVELIRDIKMIIFNMLEQIHVGPAKPLMQTTNTETF